MRAPGLLILSILGSCLGVQGFFTDDCTHYYFNKGQCALQASCNDGKDMPRITLEDCMALYIPADTKDEDLAYAKRYLFFKGFTEMGGIPMKRLDV